MGFEVSPDSIAALLRVWGLGFEETPKYLSKLL